MQRSKNMKIAILFSYIAIFFAFIGFYIENDTMTIAAIIVGIIAFAAYVWFSVKTLKSKRPN